MNFIGDFLCHVMAAYPRCVWKMKHCIYKSILKIFEAVSKRTVFKLLADRFVYHTLLLTISNIIDSDDKVRVYLYLQKKTPDLTHCLFLLCCLCT